MVVRLVYTSMQHLSAATFNVVTKPPCQPRSVMNVTLSLGDWVCVFAVNVGLDSCLVEVQSRLKKPDCPSNTHTCCCHIAIQLNVWHGSCCFFPQVARTKPINLNVALVWLHSGLIVLHCFDSCSKHLWANLSPIWIVQVQHMQVQCSRSQKGNEQPTAEPIGYAWMF